MYYIKKILVWYFRKIEGTRKISGHAVFFGIFGIWIYLPCIFVVKIFQMITFFIPKGTSKKFTNWLNE